MLAIGDIVINNIDQFYKIKNYEYIYKGGKQLALLTDTFNLNDDYLIAQNLMCKTYKRDDLYYSFHNAGNYIVLDSILQYSMADTLSFKINPLIVEYTLCKTRIKFIHNDVKQWIKRIELYSLIGNKLDKYDPAIVNKLNGYSLNISSWILKNNDIRNQMYKEKEFTLYNKKALHNIVSNGTTFYYDLLLDDNEDIIIDYTFNKLNDSEKLKACLQKLYVTTINEYIIPYLKKHNKLPVDIYYQFMSAYMDNASNMINYRFSNYLINNYYEILSNYNENIIAKKFMMIYDTKQKVAVC
tara:strand:+ start:32333 stop:33226 length:894 start_codon:yes stop_codon:yes gene_type:complete